MQNFPQTFNFFFLKYRICELLKNKVCPGVSMQIYQVFFFGRIFLYHQFPDVRWLYFHELNSICSWESYLEGLFPAQGCPCFMPIFSGAVYWGFSNPRWHLTVFLLSCQKDGKNTENRGSPAKQLAKDQPGGESSITKASVVSGCILIQSRETGKWKISDLKYWPQQIFFFHSLEIAVICKSFIGKSSIWTEIPWSEQNGGAEVA